LAIDLQILLGILTIAGAGASSYAGLRVAHASTMGEIKRLEGLLGDLRDDVRETRGDHKEYRSDMEMRVRRIEERCFTLMGPSPGSHSKD
jgi:hypothetical protein